MNPEIAIDLFKTTVMFALYIVAPFLLTLMVVGLVSSLLQSVTSLQEPTLTFAPKLIALAGLALLLTPWLLRSLTEFAISVINRMPGLAH
ncbi:flagellar biosynthetic protein FliQ [Oleiharenicola lentus]|jgi:flagellar biosynthetic protein FliQ|uniref:Flagellar biosynthetic protein FliQ n=1 Tax=Oleiharenicola lentus TaxID=2508720 RepID=A0A4Q1C3N3_9BACT|nr:flagellar biosynthetic protein FliQ [Oleiharenicola lentus]RXK52957.1 flagellar biosynthetic protein FliQ [Oleiharenicola lentus]